MTKWKLVSIILRILGVLIPLGLGIWYLSASLHGTALTYTSVDNFMNALGANGNVDSVGTKFLGNYVVELLDMLGVASEMFWAGIVDNLWIVMAAGFAIYMFVSAIKYIWEKSAQNASYTDKENNLDFKTWAEPVVKLGIRIAIAGVAIGALSMGGTDALKTVSNIIISPILYIGSMLSMATTNVGSAATCNTIMGVTELQGAMSAVSGSFMCVLGNLYSIMLAGAAGGFSLMNYAWMGLGGGMLTWLAGFACVIAFLIIGFDLFFQIFSVLFKVVFVIIFLPVLIAAFAYETVWKAASGLFRKALGIMVKAAVSMISITLKIVLLFAIIYYAADSMIPGPVDGYTSILPPLFETPEIQATTPEATSVMNVFKHCESVSLDSDGIIDKDLFKDCFMIQKQIVENEHPGAFDFMKNGWSLFITVAGLFLLYYYVLSPRIDKLIPAGKVKLPLAHGEGADLSTGEEFDIGDWTYKLGAKAWRAPRKWWDGGIQKLKDSGFIK